MVKGIIFDFDGVITDSESFYLKTVLEYLRRKNIHSKLQDLVCLLGQDMNDIAFNLNSMFELNEPIQQIIDESLQVYDEMVSAIEFKPMPGLIDFLKKAKSLDIKMAVASSSDMPYLKKHLNNFGITDYFQFILSGTDFEKSKPDPEIYNVAAAKLGINKENLIIIEDSFAGITAGNAAGIKTIGLKLSEIKQNTSIAHQQVNSFEEIEI